MVFNQGLRLGTVAPISTSRREFLVQVSTEISPTKTTCSEAATSVFTIPIVKD